MELISIGYGNYISPSRIVAALVPESNPVKRIVAQGKQSGALIDATCGRRTRAVLVMDSGHVILCPLAPESVCRRAARREDGHERQ